MAGLFDKLASIYMDARPNYPDEWYSMLADRTHRHALAWDVGTGNGQAALGLAEHYENVIASDVSEAQLKCGTQHPRVQYIHTPLSLSDDDLVTLIGGEGSVDLVTMAQAVHWFDLNSFYSIVTRLLRKPAAAGAGAGAGGGGILAVWGYNDIDVSPMFDPVMKRFHDTTLPYWHPNVKYIFDGYRTLPFPFENVGLGSEGNPLSLDIPKQLSFEGFIGMLKSWSVIHTAKEKGVDLLSEDVVKEFEVAWGGPKLVRSVVYKAFMLAGKIHSA